jgi:hypothetical protein
MATAKSYTWTPTTQTGFLNEELDNIWDAINALPSGSYVDLTTDQAVGGVKTFTAGTPFRAAGGTTSYGFVMRRTDGTGRFSFYWNTEGGTTPTTVQANEWAMQMRFAPNVTDSYVVSVFDSSASPAGTSITWDDLFKVTRDGDMTVKQDLLVERKITEYTSSNPKRHSTATTGTLTPNGNTGTFIYVAALTGNITLAAPTNMNNDTPFTILITPHASTDYTITWNSVYKWAHGYGGPANALGGDGPTVCSCVYYNASNTYCSCGEDFS